MPYEKQYDLPRSLRLLEPGDLFGVFEAANRLSGEGHRGDWSVVAGARTARLLYPMNNKGVKGYLRAELLSDARASPAFVASRNPEDWSWYLMLGLARKHAPEWRTDLLVFPDQWFTGPACVRLRCEVYRAAWGQSQADNLRKLRHIAISDAVRAGDTADKVLQNMMNEAEVGDGYGIQLLVLLDDIVNERAVVHVPVVQNSLPEFGGPFKAIVGAIQDALLRKRRSPAAQRKTPEILAPVYLRAGAGGLVSFSRPTIDGAMLGRKRMADLLSQVGFYLETYPVLMKTLNAMIPKMAWDDLRFYGRFSSNSTFCCKVQGLPGNLNVHSSNGFFLHSAFVRRRS